MNLVGRETDLDWLRTKHGDLVVSGQPGVGKTALMEAYADEGGGVFLATDDYDKVAHSLAEYRPTTLIVDDAHIWPDALPMLRDLRGAAGFRIIATCWPSETDRVTVDLGVGSDSTHELPLLKRDQILSVVDQVLERHGVSGPDLLKRIVTDQAEGKPGLAVALTEVAIAGDEADLVSGEALRRAATRGLERIADDASVMLAALAVGGAGGMAIDAVARRLGKGPLDVTSDVAGLAESGILRDNGDRTLSVRPPELGHALIRKWFFRGSAARGLFDDLASDAPDPAQVTLALIGAARQDAAVPARYLQERVEQSKSSEVWQRYAGLGENEATWVLSRHPERLMTVAKPAIYHAPQKAIPLLLSRASALLAPPETAAATPTNQTMRDRILRAADEAADTPILADEYGTTEDDPLSEIGTWVRSAWPTADQAAPPAQRDAVTRRRTLLESALVWLDGDDGDIAVFSRVAGVVLDPSFRDYSEDPGAGMTFTMTNGVIAMDEMRVVKGFWADIRDALQRHEVRDWGDIVDIAPDWARPGRGYCAVSDDYTKETKEFAVRMLTDIVQLAQDRPGVLHRIRATAHNSGIGLDIDVDLVFDTLFPDRSVLPDLAAWEIALGVQQESAEKLACLWAKQDPADAVERLLWLREEREQTYGGPQDWDVFVCERVAAAVRSPLEWARELIAKRGDHRYIVPFVRRAAEVDEPDWVQAAMQCFEDEASLPAGIVVALTVPGIPDGVFQRALAFPGELAGSILNLRMRREIPEDRMRMLIEHEDCTLARVALFAEWEADGEHSVSDSLKPAWRGAVVRCAHGPLGQTWDYDLVRMFGGDIDLFVQWLRQRLAECAAADDSVDMWSVRGVVAQVAPALDTDTRLELLGRVPLGLRDAGLLGIIANLVGDDLEAYRHLLASDGLKDYHLAPLEGDLDGTWEGKALLALGKGYGEAEIAGGSRPSDGPAVWGSISEQMRAEAERFEHLLSHDDPRIVRVGELGRDHAVRAEGGFRRMEHDRDVRGWDR